ncbi:hypothetical protein M0804_010552 [Polistes exclamans]|nr:hypothetical protein M0804_010552 [Polistes exclamans]
MLFHANTYESLEEKQEDVRLLQTRPYSSKELIGSNWSNRQSTRASQIVDRDPIWDSITKFKGQKNVNKIKQFQNAQRQNNNSKPVW